MNERELIYIKTIADTRSISKASAELYISQPSLSQSLQKIEEELGTALFVREARGMKLTFAGEKYYLMAKEILNIYSDFKSEITHINELKAGRLTIGIAGFMGMTVIPDVLSEFHKKYPNVEVVIKDERTADLEDLVLSGDIDLALTHIHKQNLDPKIDYEILAEDTFVLVAKKGYLKNRPDIKIEEGLAVNLLDLKDEKFILLEKSQGIRKVQDRIFKSYGINPNVVFVIKNFETAKRLAQRGAGLTLTPKGYLNIFNEDNYDTFELIGTEDNTWLSSILTIKGTYKSQATKVFIDEIKEYYLNNKKI
jgi:DNA-binding transcriptional LysR family regulator